MSGCRTAAPAATASPTPLPHSRQWSLMAPMAAPWRNGGNGGNGGNGASDLGSPAPLRRTPVRAATAETPCSAAATAATAATAARLLRLHNDGSHFADGGNGGNGAAGVNGTPVAPVAPVARAASSSVSAARAAMAAPAAAVPTAAPAAMAAPAATQSTRLPAPATRTSYSRVFAGEVGVVEDPATGSAALGYGVWLAASGLADAEGRGPTTPSTKELRWGDRPLCTAG